MKKKMTVHEAGRIGGIKSKRVLTSDQARLMVLSREGKKMHRNKTGFLMECIGGQTQDSNVAAGIAFEIGKHVEGFVHGFPMLWCMYGIDEEPQSKKQGEVYFLQTPDGEKIKIGFSEQLPTRVKQHKRATKENLVQRLSVAGDFDTEDEFHKLFKHWCVSGEWYGGQVMNDYLDIMVGLVENDKTLNAKRLLNTMKWKIWFTPEEEREYKKILATTST